MLHLEKISKINKIISLMTITLLTSNLACQDSTNSSILLDITSNDTYIMHCTETGNYLASNPLSIRATLNDKFEIKNIESNILPLVSNSPQMIASDNFFILSNGDYFSYAEMLGSGIKYVVDNKIENSFCNKTNLYLTNRLRTKANDLATMSSYNTAGIYGCQADKDNIVRSKKIDFLCIYGDKPNEQFQTQDLTSSINKNILEEYVKGFFRRNLDYFIDNDSSLISRPINIEDYDYYFSEVIFDQKYRLYYVGQKSDTHQYVLIWQYFYFNTHSIRLSSKAEKRACAFSTKGPLTDAKSILSYQDLTKNIADTDRIDECILLLK